MWAKMYNSVAVLQGVQKREKKMLLNCLATLMLSMNQSLKWPIM